LQNGRVRPGDKTTEKIKNFLKSKLDSMLSASLALIKKENSKQYSSVIIPLCTDRNGSIRLMLNKRSRFVPQPGDLCYPGGGPEPMDITAGWVLRLMKPGVFKKFGNKSPLIASLLATALRESWEEIKLNPLALDVLGLLPPQNLLTFNKTIVAFVCWIDEPVKIRPNKKEVEKVIWVSLDHLIEENNHAIFRLHGHPADDHTDFPCFVIQDGIAVEILWGATFRLTMKLLADILGLIPRFNPAHLIHGVYNPKYKSGYGRRK